MSALGKKVRLSRIFSHPSGRIMSVAIDHFINYCVGMPHNFKYLESTIDEIVKGAPSAITLHKGSAKYFMSKHAGKIPFIVEQIAGRSDGSFYATSTVEEIVSMGAEAIAVAITINNKTEIAQMKHLSDMVTESERFGLPVIAHIYPVGAEGEGGGISNLAEDVLYAVRVGFELGVDVVKVPFTGDVASFKDIVSTSPIPVVAAGGPKCETLNDVIKMMKDIARSGAQGATVGRNSWGFSDIPGTINALKKAMFE